MATPKPSATPGTPTERSTRSASSDRFREASLKLPALIAAIAIVYFAAGKAGLYFASFSASSTAVWPATGVAFAAVLLLGLRLWPAIFIGAFFLNLTTAGTIFTSLGIATGNTLEAVVAAYLTTRFANGRKVFESSQDFFGFVGISLFAAAISATIGLTSLALGGLAPVEVFSRIWQTWWVGDVGGFLIVAPAIVLLIEGPRTEKNHRQQIEVWLTLSVITLVGFLVFGGVFLGLRNYPLGFLCIPILVWAAFRFGQREAAAATFILAASADWGMKHGHGPWARFDDPLRAVILPQAFIITMAVMTLAMAAVVWERKRAEVEANEANLAKDRFLAMLGHELRNPLMPIILALDVLRNKGVADTEEHRIIERQVGNLKRLVDDLLDIERLVRGKVELRQDSTELTTVISAALETVTPIINEKQHKLEIQVPKHGLSVFADHHRLTQAFTNLLNNAARYTSPRGNIKVLGFRNSDEVVVEVTDDGEGIDPELLPRVFDMFTQRERSIDRPDGGLGLGLAIVKNLVELHGGQVVGESAGLGQGSKFIVRLPLYAAASTSPGSPTDATSRVSSSLPGKYIKVLVVDDNQDAAETVAEVLSLNGYLVRCAFDGDAALSVLSEFQPEIAILDIGLPGMSGYDLAKEIARRDGRVPRMVALSGYGQPSDIEMSRVAGFHSHLVKPLDIDSLLKALSVLQE